MKEFKIGEWVTCDEYTFVIVHIGDCPVGGTTYEEESYFDIYYEGFITYHCRQASQEEIENACKVMLETIV